ncbi:hypothetical protein [Polaribacter sp. R77954]|uniref:hypothetical protein n=1 Tax=Polaribacter sp. R77954 TaxID=3093870 RepID=UPI0037C7168E
MDDEKYLKNEMIKNKLSIPKNYFEHNIYIKDDLTYPETECEYLNEKYYLNSEFVNEMYLLNEYKNKYHYGTGYHQWDINNIKIKLTGINFKKEKKKILKKELLKLNKKIKENPLALSYITEDKNLDIRNKKFIPFVKEYVFINDGFYAFYLIENTSLENYINSDEMYSINPHIYSWISFIRTMKTIEFINKELIKLENQQPANLTKNKKTLTTNQKLILLDNIRIIKDWESYDKTKKARLISYLIDRNYDNTKDGLDLLEKKPSQQTPRFKKDLIDVEKLIKDTLG